MKYSNLKHSKQFFSLAIWKWSALIVYVRMIFIVSIIIFRFQSKSNGFKLNSPFFQLINWHLNTSIIHIGHILFEKMNFFKQLKPKRERKNLMPNSETPPNTSRKRLGMRTYIRNMYITASLIASI